MSNENKKNIVIVECRSTGTNYIADIYNRGYYPVLLDTKAADTETGEKYTEILLKEHEDITYDFDLITEQDNYEETLELVKEYDPLLVLPGNEKGVILASKLAYDLNLKCNDIKNLDAMTLKNEMQSRLAEKGLRSIRGKVIKSIDEAIEFYESEELSQVVIKPIYSAGSVSVRICTNKDEMIHSLEELLGQTNAYGDELTEMLIQERIVGDEYIVNTVSSEGQHRVTLVWKYHKVMTAEGAIIYDTCETVNELNLGEAEMVEYAYDVADALGIEWGPVHGEYMIDEKGPVLIEVNCRPCGGHMSAEFIDKISGQHETDSILDAYLKPERFQEKLTNRYQLHSYGALKFFIVPKDMIATSSPMKKMSYKLESHMKTAIELDEEDKKTFFKTVDLDSSCGIVYLANEDYSELQDNINYLRNVEKHAFSLILNEEEPEEMGDIDTDLNKIKELIDYIDKYGTGLFVTDQVIPECDILQISPSELDSAESEFDMVIVNMKKTIFESTVEEMVEIVLNISKKVKTGGTIFVPESTYNKTNIGRNGIEALVKLLGLKIDLPPYGLKNYIVASKR